MLLDDILVHNQKFVEDKAYAQYETDKFPSKKAVILTCMDARLLELLPKAVNLKNGDAKIIQNAGAMLVDTSDSVMKSILVAIHALKGEEVFVIGHKDCGMHHLHGSDMLDQISKQGGDVETYLRQSSSEDIANTWFDGFNSVEESVESSASLIANHPLLPKQVPVHALVIDPATGELTVIRNGYEKTN
ncbi:beta-class carbonic anhydrase [Terribacillus saccharophilus]|uniref:beta-class carbonic anhydrase n=1 Tax=Terribacillus saccharophilus TaxID=361277 RepID=UPI000BA7E385|nr:carbonic anhydrase [Terribacillus saccharophilus]PAF17600.1 carbonic anhydrase [Terribacillus saccharophilus]